MNGDIKRVLKAPTEPIVDFASLQFGSEGLYASDKEDGIRCVIHPLLRPVSQKMLPIPNLWVRRLLDHAEAHHLDGELVAIDCEGNTADFNDTQSAIMTRDGQPRFEFRVFDWFGNQYAPYKERIQTAQDIVEVLKGKGFDQFQSLEQTVCYTPRDVELAEELALERGKEGLMLRSFGGWYKEGRSTLAEQYLLKVKRFVDDEAIVIGVEEEMENCNLATRDAGGLQKRSKHTSGMKGKGMVGKLICKWRGKEIQIGSGLTHAQKKKWWIDPKGIVGHRITFCYQKHGMKDLPRCPRFKGIRYD